MGNKFYTYVLLSKKDDRVYIGQTNDVNARLKMHSEGRVISTRNRRPFKLIFTEEYETRSEAFKRERFLKSGRGGKWLQEYIGGSARGGPKNL